MPWFIFTQLNTQTKAREDMEHSAAGINSSIGTGKSFVRSDEDRGLVQNTELLILYWNRFKEKYNL